MTISSCECPHDRHVLVPAPCSRAGTGAPRRRCGWRSPAWCTATSPVSESRASRARTCRSSASSIRIAALAAEVREAVQRCPTDVFFTDLATMLDRTTPQAVAIFTSTLDHAIGRRGVRAARHVPVMMEKPLAVEHAAGARDPAGGRRAAASR